RDQGQGSACIDDGQRYNSLGPCGGGSRLNAEVIEAGLAVGQVTATQAMLEFAVPQAGQVDMSVFDVTGRRLATIASETMEAGVDQRTWDMSGAAKGLYFVRLRVAGTTLTRTLVKTR